MRADDARRPQLLADLGGAPLERALRRGRTRLAEAIGSPSGPATSKRVRARLWQMRLRFQIDPDADYEALEAEGLEAARSAE